MEGNVKEPYPECNGEGEHAPAINYMTAEEYLMKHEPELLDLFLDRREALLEETIIATALANRLGIEPEIRDGGCIAYPETLWQSLSGG